MKPNHHRFSRRQFLRQSAVAAAAGFFAVRLRGAAAPRIADLETWVISLDHENYHGWPTVTRLRSGRLMAVCSGGREQHVCPFGRVDCIVSDDEGRTWSWPRTLLDGDLDDRDAGVLETPSGALLVTSFTSLAYEPTLAAAEKSGKWAPERLRRWQAARDRLDAGRRKAELGQWMIRSTNGGRTWSSPYSSRVNSPHGPVVLANGRLFYAGVQLWAASRRVEVCESIDDGQTWRWLADIPIRDGDRMEQYHELHAVEAASGRLVVQIRNHNPANANETLQTESEDGGRTWSVPHPIGVWGLPSHLLRLRNGNLLMTYGHRRAPLGNQVRLSLDEGRTWSDPLILSGDGTSTDLGYPSTVELEDGTLLTVWYEALKGNPRAVLRQARWRIAST